MSTTRLLAILLAVLSLPLFMSPVQGQPGQDDRQHTIAEIKKLGGSVYDDPASQGVTVALSGTRVTDEDLRLLKALPNIRRLNLDDTAITDAGLKHIKDLPALQEVSLYRTNVTEAGVQDLRKARPGLIALHSPRPQGIQFQKLLVLLILIPFVAIGVFLLLAGLLWRSKPVRLRIRAAMLGGGLILVCILLSLIALLQALGFDITVSRLFG